MKASTISCLFLLSVACAPALAQSTVKTEAERDRANLTARGNYPVIKFDSKKTRAEVKAELGQLQRAQTSRSSKQQLQPKRPSQPKQPNKDRSLYNGA